MMKVFAIRDVKADSFMPPMAIHNAAVAARIFSEMCQDGRTDFAKYPSDYMLYEVGTWEPNSGQLVALSVPLLVISASEAIASVRCQREINQPSLPLKLEEVSQ